MWKYWLTEESSSSGEVACCLVKTALTKRDSESIPPGRNLVPRPRLYWASGTAGAKEF